MNATVLIGVSSVAATIIAALIQRSWQWSRRRLPRYEQLEYGPIHESESFSALDVVKILDLTESGGGPSGRPGRAIYTDSYLVRRESSEGNGLVFRYATSGQLTGECLSHTDGQSIGSYESTHFASSLAIGVSLEHLARGSHARIINKVVYTGAFDKPDQEDFETHVERPMQSLTMILTFSKRRPCGIANGQTQINERGRVEAARNDGPIIANDGRVVYWRITPKKGEWLPIGAKYRLQWTWHKSGSGSANPAPVALERHGSA
jgi:hypothetical protein